MAIASHADEARDGWRLRRKRVVPHTTEDFERIERSYRELEELVNIMNRHFPRLRDDLRRVTEENEKLRRENNALRKQIQENA